jgi:hypothetical protein
MEDNRSYFMKRAAQERSAASRATGKAREAHEQMAERYRDLAEHLDQETEGTQTAS